MKLRQIDAIDAHASHATDMAFGAATSRIALASADGGIRLFTLD